MIVSRLSLSFSIVLDAIIPGIPHPDEIKSGIKLFPESPNLRKIRSMTKATLTIYPQSSRIESNTNKIAICGRNPSTAPSPPIIPLRSDLQKCCCTDRLQSGCRRVLNRYYQYIIGPVRHISSNGHYCNRIYNIHHAKKDWKSQYPVCHNLVDFI